MVDADRSRVGAYDPLDRLRALRLAVVEGALQHAGDGGLRQAGEARVQRHRARPRRQPALREAVIGVREGRRVPVHVQHLPDPAAFAGDGAQQQRRGRDGVEHLAAGGQRRVRQAGCGSRGGGRGLRDRAVPFRVVPDPAALGRQQLQDRPQFQAGARVGHATSVSGGLHSGHR
ncbi:hypothetical protein [Streptomyces boninensis]|uniref:hypothetical protein n=1 Tax=Streptomyces boninensis TaxID=2039455 RepID=UPI003B228E62